MSTEVAIDRVRFSRLKLFAKSAAHYRANPPWTSSALDKGTAAHAVLLKGARVTYYDGKVKTKKGEPPSDKIGPRNGEQWEAFKLANADATILTLSEYEETNRIVASVRANKDALALLAGKIEDTIEFDYMGVPSRTTPDARRPEFAAELKTCRSSEPYAFAWQMKKLFYHAQMAFHVEGMRAVNPRLNPAPYIVAVESSAPYPVTVFRVTPAAMQEGARLIRLWFEQLKVCMASDVWPPYSQSVVDLDIPGGDTGVIFPDEAAAA